MMTRVHLCGYQIGNLDLYGAYKCLKLSHEVNIHSEKKSNKYLTLRASIARKKLFKYICYKKLPCR
jgi:hypothetical protein